MALRHSGPLDIIDVRPLGADLPDTVTTSLLKSPALQLIRLVLCAGHSVPEHRVRGAITVHCLEGEAVVSTPARECKLHEGELVMLEGNVPHAVKAVKNTSLLVTVLLHTA